VIGSEARAVRALVRDLAEIYTTIAQRIVS